MNVIYDNDKQRLPIKNWATDLEQGAIDQAMNLANHPAIFKHVSIMPDGHQGYGMPIGGVIATKDVVIPNAVGVDIGCGMAFLETNIPVSILTYNCDTQNRSIVKCVLDSARRVIPVGFGRHKTQQEWVGFNSAPELDIIQENLDVARCSLGTLGGGNHFIELQKNSKGNLCIMLHSGSRNLGYKVCGHFNKLAEDLNAKYWSKVPLSWELAFLPMDTQEGQDYVTAMNFALDFAKQNRYVMMERFKSLVFNLIEKHYGHISKTVSMEVNAHHNYAATENHFGENVMIHRKGAIRAREGDMGIIPGSMETQSYIVKGLGNKDSFDSASHGAGRVMSRTNARKTFNIDDMVARFKKKGIEVSTPDISKILDESGPAYKDIAQVIENEKDLVEVVEIVSQIGVIKG